MLSQSTSSQPAWTPWLLAIAGFWLGSNLVLDLLVMPAMYVSGMTTQAGFASAGYSLFWSFNRMELLCAAVILTGVLALQRQPGEFEVAHSGSRCRWALALGVVLISLTLVDTYLLAPEMSALALPLDAAQTTIVPSSMAAMHAAYWLLETLKVLCLGGVVGLCIGDLREVSEVHANAVAS